MRLVEWIPVVIEAEEVGAVGRQGGSVAAALAPAGGVVLLEITPRFPAWTPAAFWGSFLGSLAVGRRNRKMCVCEGPALFPRPLGTTTQSVIPSILMASLLCAKCVLGLSEN